MSEPMKEKFIWRLINLGLGALYVILALYVVVNPGIAVEILVIILAVVLLFSGTLRVFNAFFEKDRSGFYRIFYLVLGIFTVLLGLGVILLQDLGLELLIILLAIGLAIQGISRVGTGLRSGPLPNWLQGLFVLTGLATLGLAVYVLISTEVAVLTLTLFLAYGFLLNGFSRMVIAVTGYNPYKDTTS